VQKEIRRLDTSFIPDIIEVKGLCKSYDNGVEVIKPLSFGVLKSQILGIIGPKNSGSVFPSIDLFS